ncbi:MAG: outer membrane protein assembly factor BamB [Gammaproteobacteria bacterium]|nr:outer membrane protein assembly factor BamB [Gammaproteobacteria bacterium]
MRGVFITSAALLLALGLSACGTSPKAYTEATPLTPVQTRQTVETLWVVPAGGVPEDAHAQLPLSVVDGRIYLADGRGEVSVLSADTGEVIWSRELGDALDAGPGVGAGMIFVATREAEVVALDQKDGAERWRVRISSEMLAQPKVAGKLLIVQTVDGKLSALDVDSGKRVWSHSRSIPKLTLRGSSTPLLMGERVVAGFADGKLVALDIKTGELLWETTVGESRGRNDLERLVDIDGLFESVDGVIYAASYQGRVVALSAEDGGTIWARKMSSYTGLAVGGKQIFISDVEGNVWALDANTGATLWRQKNLRGRELSAPAVLGDDVIVADYDGYVHWLSDEDGEFVARQSLDELWGRFRMVWDSDEDAEEPHRSVTVPPVVSHQVLYLRDNVGALAAFQLPATAPATH